MEVLTKADPLSLQNERLTAQNLAKLHPFLIFDKLDEYIQLDLKLYLKKKTVATQSNFSNSSEYASQKSPAHIEKVLD